MRFSASSKSASSAVRVLAVILLSGAAASCSSDVTRFNGIFSSKTDDITTNSVPHQSTRIIGEMPTPRRDVARVAAVPVDDGGPDQPFPTTQKVTHQAVSTSTDGLSGARASVTPIVVQKAELSDPTISTPKVVAKVPAAKIVVPDTTVTGTVPGNRWQVSDNSPRIVLKSGETISLISRRFSVPEKEIVRVNGLKNADSARAGATIIIPTFGNNGSLAKAKVAADVALAKPADKKIPVPVKTDDNVAILPGSSTRDKTKVVVQSKVASNDDKADKGEEGIYVVKPGDSLARIARNHKTTVDALKAANGMESAQLRIGQKLRLSASAPAVAANKVAKADQTTTASIPKVSETKKVAEQATEPVARKSVAEAEKSSDVTDTAPVSTGISKYRWPVRGAVVAGFGANVDGERNTGIDISVPEGTPVKAAENGVVIYSGAGLKELGNTVLIRHDDGTVTVYGNASDLKVARGQKVQRGQIIASSGMTGGAKQPKLHFEVRKNASPVNPMTFLE